MSFKQIHLLLAFLAICSSITIKKYNENESCQGNATLTITGDINECIKSESGWFQDMIMECSETSFKFGTFCDKNCWEDDEETIPTCVITNTIEIGDSNKVGDNCWTALSSSYYVDCSAHGLGSVLVLLVLVLLV
eukprot:TRINITY_DN883_c0_g1_i1.p1 TRINITY_DN883_c0_g1~~TRINITY_DN883_c0_g1_i1.p1  ORF type:complete len:135 (-),score=19.59 TRINITY_DN883_c0_g1_i1:71-475(-)